MLLCAGELVEQRGFAAVLIAHQGVSKHGVLRQGAFVLLGVVLARLPQTGVGRIPGTDGPKVAAAALGDGLNFDVLRLGQAEGQLIAVDLELHGVAHRGQLHHGDFRPGDHAHV